MNDAIEAGGWWEQFGAIALLRLTPVVPFRRAQIYQGLRSGFSDGAANKAQRGQPRQVAVCRGGGWLVGAVWRDALLRLTCLPCSNISWHNS